ncbi:hypothetical protein [Flavobacterium ovatum]|uniref:hypothetical protein n=1 Tax=Flavobacterium ovatum TaxID=1928857 RepID=UPI00344B6CF0
MKKYLILLMVLFVTTLVAQEIPTSDKDKQLKETIYAANKKKVMNYSKKQFDALFFEFFENKNNPNIVLTKEAFYNYTIQISIYSDRLAALYPEEKQIALENKKKWISEDYEDYLISIKSKKLK